MAGGAANGSDSRKAGRLGPTRTSPVARRGLFLGREPINLPGHRSGESPLRSESGHANASQRNDAMDLKRTSLFAPVSGIAVVKASPPARLSPLNTLINREVAIV
jgi:hypothetical protein